jgi:predicted signal transduction protein with EAL and GGDEF domain
VNTVNDIFDVVSIPFVFDDLDFVITSSIGICQYPSDTDEPEKLVRNADTAMHYAKEQGKNRIQLYSSDLNEDTIQKMLLEKDLRKALHRGPYCAYIVVF